MPNTGKYSGPSPFRTGQSKNQLLESLHQTLNEMQGSAYNTQVGSLVSAENYAYAKAIADMFEAGTRLSNNLNPGTSVQYLSRWEKFLGISPGLNDSVSERQQAIQFKFSQWTKPANLQNTADMLKALVPTIFVGLEYYSPSDNLGSFPGGLTVPGGVTLPDGDFIGPLCTVIVRVWKPRTPAGLQLISDADFNKALQSYDVFLNDYLPAYVVHQTYYYNLIQTGTVSVGTNQTVLSGIGTTFTSTLFAGQSIEVIDTNNQPQTLTIVSITSDTSAVIDGSPSNIVNSQYSILGFQLDIPQNLDNAVFDRNH